MHPRCTAVREVFADVVAGQQGTGAALAVWHQGAWVVDLVGLDEPLSTYWPELRTDTTLRRVLAHRSGLVLLDEPADESALFDWAELCRRIAEQEPTWPPGTAQGESALLFGHLVGELVRRVDGLGCSRRTCGER